MTDIEQKALALINGTFLDPHYRSWSEVPKGWPTSALCRAIEQHEAFRQEVSDAVVSYFQPYDSPVGFQRFIIHKPDPLVAALEGVTFDHYPPNDAKTIRAALEARGLEIREKNDD